MICKNLSHAKIRWKHPFRIFQHKKSTFDRALQCDFYTKVRPKKWIYKSIKKNIHKRLQCCLIFKQKQVFHVQKKTKTGVKRDIHKTTKKEKFRYLPNFFLYVCLIFCFNRPYKLLVIRSKKNPHEKSEWITNWQKQPACCFIISFSSVVSHVMYLWMFFDRLYAYFIHVFFSYYNY